MPPRLLPPPPQDLLPGTRPPPVSTNKSRIFERVNSRKPTENLRLVSGAGELAAGLLVLGRAHGLLWSPTERPLHHSERILEQVLEWSGLESPRSAFLVLKKFPVAEKRGRGAAGAANCNYPSMQMMLCYCSSCRAGKLARYDDEQLSLASGAGVHLLS